MLPVSGIKQCILFPTRGQLVRKLEPPYLHFAKLPSEGITPASVLVLVSNNGKTNQFGKLEFFACLQAHSVYTCPVSAITFYFFCRWHIDNKLFISSADGILIISHFLASNP
jgi:hypothetical protein